MQLTQLHLLSAINQELLSRPVCCPLVHIQAQPGTKHIHTAGLSPVPVYSSAAPSEHSPIDECQYAWENTHANVTSWCAKKTKHELDTLIFYLLLSVSVWIPLRRGRSPTRGECMLPVFWEQAKRKRPASQTVLPHSDPHLTSLHLNISTEKGRFISNTVLIYLYHSLYCILCQSMSMNSNGGLESDKHILIISFFTYTKLNWSLKKLTIIILVKIFRNDAIKS